MNADEWNRQAERVARAGEIEHIVCQWNRIAGELDGGNRIVLKFCEANNLPSSEQQLLSVALASHAQLRIAELRKEFEEL